MIERCSICGIDPAVWRCSIKLPKPLKLSGKFWKDLLDGEEITHIIENMCDLCLSFAREAGAQIEEVSRIEPKQIPLSLSVSKDVYQDTIKELMTYGVTWCDAVNLDYWFIRTFFNQIVWPRYPEIRKIYFDYKFGETYTRKDYKELSQILEKFLDSLAEKVSENGRIVLEEMWDKLSYIFSKYGEDYKFSHPSDMSEEEWTQLVDEMIEFFTGPKPQKWGNYEKSKIKKFIKNIFGFWY